MAAWSVSERRAKRPRFRLSDCLWSGGLVAVAHGAVGEEVADGVTPREYGHAQQRDGYVQDVAEGAQALDQLHRVDVEP